MNIPGFKPYTPYSQRSNACFGTITPQEVSDLTIKDKLEKEGGNAGTYKIYGWHNDDVLLTNTDNSKNYSIAPTSRQDILAQWTLIKPSTEDPKISQ